MYRIYINDQTASYPIYEPLDDTLRVFKPILTQEMGQGGYFQFYILTTHPYADKIGLLKTELIVYEDDEEIFHGRILKPEYNMDNLIHITCEGELTYLNDSQQRPYEFTGTISEFISWALATHNEQVDDYKKIYKGNIVVSDVNDKTTRSNTSFSTTIATLKSKLVDVHGGYLRIRRNNGVKYLDYLWDFGGINNQVIRFGENLLDLNRYLDATSIITCLIPMGAEIEYKDSLGVKQTTVVDITSVNDGKDYIQDASGVAKYGKVWGSYQWPDIAEPADLLTKAKSYLSEVSALPVTMEINALDLSLIDTNVQRFRLGYWTNVSSEPHGIDQQLLLAKRVINLLDPTKGSITLGKTSSTISGTTKKIQVDTAKAISKVVDSTSSEIKRKVENATALITGGLGGYVVLDNIDPNTGEQIHPWRILIMNTPDKDTAKNVIQFNQNGIGFSTSGINGPYANAWTIDGNLVADFITTGTMLADRIRGGTLELGGTGLGKDGKITVMDAGGNTIGYWDKTGLNVLKGTIKGTNIVGSNIEGGTIDIGNGTFEVSSNGEVSISSGEINIGGVYICDGYAWLGDFGISAGGAGVLYSRDSQQSVVIYSIDSTYGNGPAIVLTRGSYATRIGYGGVYTHSITLKELENEYGTLWGSVSKNIIALWDRIESLGG